MARPTVGTESGSSIAKLEMLQGFPKDYPFARPYIKKQIENAFLPVVVEPNAQYLLCFLQQLEGVNGDVPGVNSIDSSDPSDDDSGGGSPLCKRMVDACFRLFRMEEYSRSVVHEANARQTTDNMIDELFNLDQGVTYLFLKEDIYILGTPNFR